MKLSLRMDLSDFINQPYEKDIISKLEDIHKDDIKYYLTLWYRDGKISPDDINKFLPHQIIPSMQPSHCTSDMPWLEDRLGSHRINRISKWKTFIDKGLKIAGGSDCPIETGNPLFEFYAACTRQDHSGYPKGGWQPQEKVNSIEALKMLTTWGAYAEFHENRRGKIKIGFDADLTILSNDITQCDAQEVLDTEIIMTIVSGKVVHNNY